MEPSVGWLGGAHFVRRLRACGCCLRRCFKSHRSSSFSKVGFNELRFRDSSSQETGMHKVLSSLYLGKVVSERMGLGISDTLIAASEQLNKPLLVAQ